MNKLNNSLVRRFISYNRNFCTKKSDNVLKIEIIDNQSMLQKIIRNPFKSYFKIGSFTFGLTFVSNFLTTVIYNDQLEFLKQNPQIFTTGVLTKSCYFGILWPSFYINTIKNPNDTMVLGNGIMKSMK